MLCLAEYRCERAFRDVRSFFTQTPPMCTRLRLSDRTRDPADDSQQNRRHQTAKYSINQRIKAPRIKVCGKEHYEAHYRADVTTHARPRSTVKSVRARNRRSQFFFPLVEL